MDPKQITENAKEQFNILFENMFEFDDADMVNYNECFANVFNSCR